MDGDYKVALHNLNAHDFVEAGSFFAEILPLKRISSIGVMLQHTSERVLKRMNRTSLDVDAFVSLWNRVAAGGVLLNTHLIVGFPGEREEVDSVCRQQQPAPACRKLTAIGIRHLNT